MADEMKIADAVVEYLFKDYSGDTADRLLLIKEDHMGKAKVSDAKYLGGWGRKAARDAVVRVLRDQREGSS